MKAIKLNHPIDNYENGTEYLQFRYAFFWYSWRRSRHGNQLLCPMKSKVYWNLFYYSLMGLALILGLMTAGNIAGYPWLGACIGVAAVIPVILLKFHRTRKFYAALPKTPIAIIYPQKRKLLFRRNLPCIQILEKRLTLDFEHLLSALWEQSNSMQNGTEKVQIAVLRGDSPVGGFYLNYHENGQKTQELIFCGQHLRKSIYGKIMEQCQIVFE